jgi:Family of unknown function (DUF6314)
MKSLYCDARSYRRNAEREAIALRVASRLHVFAESSTLDHMELPPLERLWADLSRVRSLWFVARSENATGWNGEGQGIVVVEAIGNDVQTFTESGTWRTEAGRELRFHNVYRWTRTDPSLRLEHLRFGVDHPVYLFDLAQTGDREWRSLSPHLCGEDRYSAVLLVGDSLVLRWEVVGPTKQELIEYDYSRDESPPSR